ncbi:hypothetical protein EWM64_g9020 [Hericium alpestre]|uniref:Uncharacterized protein n=1 Tax=Hericium alpestre TaxID=135208 RepID=A0A4Y9ZJT5_9AGAM|nr:hypothetical protein EWM64_g9020 [Hericium alpestre]
MAETAPVSKAEEAGDGDLPRPVSAHSSSLKLIPSGLRDYLFTEVEPSSSTLPLAAYCFMTGYMPPSDAISFSAIFVWCGFQTGNSVQLALALARLFQGPPGHRDTSFHLADQQALTSLLTFVFGASIGRIEDVTPVPTDSTRRKGGRRASPSLIGTAVKNMYWAIVDVCTVCCQ